MTPKDTLKNLLAEFVAMYCIAFTIGYLAYFRGHMSTFEDFGVIVAYMVVAIPFCATVVTVGPNFFMRQKMRCFLAFLAGSNPGGQSLPASGS